MASPDVYFTWPTLFSPFPHNLPAVVPPPVTEGSLRSPFGIDKDLYNFFLRPEVPILFATTYVLVVFSLNAYNRRHNHEPWRISKHPAFRYFVVIHNVVLALYSFATFVAMFRAISHTLPSWGADNFKVRVADGLCKLHGPRGLGDAATFNTTINIWEVKNSLIQLGYNGNPDPTDVGRLWNEGLAFWGWTFYVSKFYEVIDTGIIIAKGKRSATLQTYHHAGAMLCMWAGIRYMSPPIWMFVFINSGIHAMMYLYFTLSALNVRVSSTLKRGLTMLQIGQFVFGASYAALHLFIQYDIPIQTPFEVVNFVERIATRASTAAHSVTSAASSFAESPSLSPAVGAYLKKLLLRAAGEEGVAERVGIPLQDRLLHGAVPRIEEQIERIWEKTFETQYNSDWTRINCIDTTGEAFAIYLNLLYLAPLTFLFLRFFVRAYTGGSKRRTASEAARDASKSARQAHEDMTKAIEKAGKEAEDELHKRGSQAADDVRAIEEEMKKDLQSVRDGTWKERRISEKVSEKVQTFESRTKEFGSKVKESVNGSGSPRRSSPTKKTDEKSASKSSLPNESAIEDEPDKSYADAVKEDFQGEYSDDKENQAEYEESETAESKEKQEENIEASQDIRPGTEDADDTDAMGKSGIKISDKTSEPKATPESIEEEGEGESST